MNPIMTYAKDIIPYSSGVNTFVYNGSNKKVTTRANIWPKPYISVFFDKLIISFCKIF